MEPQLIQQETRRRDLRAYEPRVMLEITVRPLSQVVEGHVVPQGTHRILVAESRVDAVRELVETEKDRAMLAQAREMFERELSRWTATGQKAETFGGSLEREFHKIAGRGLAPITSLKVLPGTHAPIVSDDEVKSAGVAAAMLSQLERMQSRGDADASDEKGARSKKS
ncbi:hypothetical protein [Sandaracinus amylolyticus]|uniref:hypothetical protein n=1 Tax=Sandaracinus amylolyticus TaxID=927083 RepID=UPI001F3D12A8|nr:hypothetical protein [Sandaracinus amylolyticus]UJR81485.1 Hypothetical protein I5071_35450 [Sandaracinus amylolyticus]